ncbi:DNA polymerase III PolC-type-like [Ostrea edulis]|uniref:DNA polymerase III PolC-type-like n=1 Tax=Ostrea edulis TaxID=37623 RepID=UPI0024AEA817|nr:DNA polymerase III PolC-type-like [Ostrea edulis]
MAARSEKGKFVKASRFKQIHALRKGCVNYWKTSDEEKLKETIERPVITGITPLDDHIYVDNVARDVVQEEIVSPSANVTSRSDWRDGRRIVELDVIAKNLEECRRCGQPLHLSDCVGKTRFGLAQIPQVQCRYSECRLVNDVPTGKKHQTEKGGKAWDINTKLAAGMINSGLGETHLNTFLAVLNVPGISKQGLKEREREVGNTLKKMAEESCQAILLEEVEKSDGNLTVSFDGAWQKRGTGRSYNSLTGHASLIGEKTKKCLGYSVKSKKCRICDSAKQKNVPVRKHNCSRNWSGSAKAMEPAMACEMVQNIMDQGEKMETLVMDNDSTTIARLRTTVDPDIKKKADSNHTKKGFTGSLVEMSSIHKVLKNVKVRTHIERCFMYCVRQAAENSEKLASDLKKIVPHLYGDHSTCGTWCKSESTDYKPKNLPYGKPLTSEPLRLDLEKLFQKYAGKASELVSMGSTQVNENFNHMVSSKAPKRLFYGGSDSLQNRVSATVCQKNEGYSYIAEVNKRLSMSPGRYTIKRSRILQSKLKWKRLQQAKRSTKRRRLELKSERSTKDATQSVLEADMYCSRIGMKENIDLEDISLPQPVELPSDSNSYVLFDLETTGLARTSDIVQIAAVCGDREFNKYVTPQSPISLDASSATGLTFVGGVLKHNGRVVEHEEPFEGLQQFVEFVKTVDCKPVLVGHNIQNFDLPILIIQLVKYELFDSFASSVSGFIDTLKVAKGSFSKKDVENFKQITLVSKFVGKHYEAHNAIADVKALKELFEVKLLTLCNASDVFTLNYYTIKKSLEPLVKAKVLSSMISKKLIANSLSLSKLEIIHKRDPHNGLRNVFCEPLSGSKQPRISKSMNVINKLVDYLNSCA